MTVRNRLTRSGAKHLYIDGGITIQEFLAAGLIDELTITLIPIILGEGIPLFGPLPTDVQLQCIGTQSFACGFTQIHYAVIR